MMAESRTPTSGRKWGPKVARKDNDNEDDLEMMTPPEKIPVREDSRAGWTTRKRKRLTFG